MKLSKGCLGQAFRFASGPVLCLAGVCTTVGSLFLRLGSGANWIFIAADGSALLAFHVLGARAGRNGEPGRQRL